MPIVNIIHISLTLKMPGYLHLHFYFFCSSGIRHWDGGRFIELQAEGEIKSTNLSIKYW